MGSQVSRSTARTATGSGHAEKCSGRWSRTERVSNTQPHAAPAVCCPEGRLGGRPSGRLGVLTPSLASPHASSARCLDRDSEDSPQVSRTAGSQGPHLPEAGARSPRHHCHPVLSTSLQTKKPTSRLGRESRGRIVGLTALHPQPKHQPVLGAGPSTAPSVPSHKTELGRRGELPGIGRFRRWVMTSNGQVRARQLPGSGERGACRACRFPWHQRSGGKRRKGPIVCGVSAAE